MCRGQRVARQEFFEPSDVYRGRQYFMSRYIEVSKKKYTEYPEYEPNCKLIGGKLAELKTQGERRAAEDYNIKIVQCDCYYYIGLYYREEIKGWVYKSDNSTATYLVWNPYYNIRCRLADKCHCAALATRLMYNVKCIPNKLDLHLCEVPTPVC